MRFGLDGEAESPTAKFCRAALAAAGTAREDNPMPAPRIRDLAAVHVGRNVASVRLPGWVDLMGDPVRGGDGLLVTLAIDPGESVTGQDAHGLGVTTAAAVQAVLVDGRSDVIRRLSLGSGEVAVLVVDGGLRPADVDRDRSARAAECLEAARALGKQSLRDVDDTLWRRWHDELPTVLQKRAVHVRGEQTRTLELVAAVERGDWSQAGLLMTASQRSLMDDFEVVCPALDSLWAATVAQPGVFGSRRAGGGFAGQVVALVAADRAEAIATAAAAEYRRETNQQPGWCVAAVAADPTADV